MLKKSYQIQPSKISSRTRQISKKRVTSYKFQRKCEFFLVILHSFSHRFRFYYTFQTSMHKEASRLKSISYIIYFEFLLCNVLQCRKYVFVDVSQRTVFIAIPRKSNMLQLMNPLTYSTESLILVERMAPQVKSKNVKYASVFRTEDFGPHKYKQ